MLSETKGRSNSIKFSFNDEIRKLHAINDYKEMIEVVRQAYGLTTNKFVVKYYDEDEDLITIENQGDFTMALDFFDNKVPKLFIYANQDQNAFSVIGMNEIIGMTRTESNTYNAPVSQQDVNCQKEEIKQPLNDSDDSLQQKDNNKKGCMNNSNISNSDSRIGKA